MILLFIIFGIAVTINAENPECFKDCYDSVYNGIKSFDENGNRCLKWTNESNLQKDSYICRMNGKNRPWCYTEKGWGYCTIPECYNSHEKSDCFMGVNVETTSSKIKIKWMDLINQEELHSYVTLLYNDANICERYQMQTCDKCHIIFNKTFDFECNSTTILNKIKQEVIFDNLKPNTEYIVYIIPKFKLVETFEVMKISLKTKLKSKFNREQFYHFFDIKKVLKDFNLEESISKFELLVPKENIIVFENNLIQKIKINCNLREFLVLNLKLKKNNFTFTVPINVSCGLQEPENVLNMLTSKCSINALNIYWNVTTNATYQYFMMFISSDGYILKYIKSENTSFIMDNIECSKWHQICIATIDSLWRTSKYTCVEHLLNPRPVTNLNVYSMTHEIYVFWEKLKEEIHEGYVVTIYLPNGSCRTTIINIQHNCINVQDNCRYRDIIRWEFIMPLKIKDLSSNTNYKISVSSVIRNNISIPRTVAVTTRIQESIKDLKIIRKLSNILIQFTPPNSAKNVNLKYRVKISLHGINMCTFKYKVIFDNIIEGTQKIISINSSNRCFNYEIEVLPMGQCMVDTRRFISEEPQIEYVPFIKKGSLYNNIVKSVSLENITVFLVSSTLLKISWRNNISMYECNNFGFMIELINVQNENDCKTWILTRTTCTMMLDNLSGESKCKNKEYLKFQGEHIKTTFLLQGNFKNSNSYIVAMWKITDVITKILNEEVTYKNNAECSADCYGPKSKEMTNSTRDKLLSKRKEEFLDSFQELENYKSNICCVDESSYIYNFCFNEKDGDKIGHLNYTCETVTKDNTCMKDIQIVSSNKLVTIKFPKLSNGIKGYLILLHNTNKECLRYIIKTCADGIKFMVLKSPIQKFYTDCKLGTTFNQWDDETSLSDLETHTEYLIYIFPLFNHRTFGQMSTVTVGTTIADSITPNYITIQNRSFDSLQFSWNSYREKTFRPYIAYYAATLVNMRSNVETSLTSHNEIMEFQKLESCTKYCFYLTVVDSFGLSELVDFVCGYTLSSNLGLLRLNNIESGPSLTRVVSWKYSGNDDCPRYYRIEVFNHDLNKRYTKTTNGTKLLIGNLVENLPYKIRVRMETFNHIYKSLDISEYSEWKVFFTGHVRTTISDVYIKFESSRKVLLVYWQMETSTVGSMFEYIVHVRNKKNECLGAIIFLCEPSTNIYKSVYLSTVAKSKWQKLSQCSQISWSKFITSINFFGGKLEFSKALNNSEVKIYGLNLLGIHILYTQSL